MTSMSSPAATSGFPSPAAAGWKQLVCRRLFEPVDNSSLTVFRMAFGIAVACYAWETLTTPVLAADYIQPTLHLTYWGFEWVRPWRGDGMYLHFLALFVAGIGTALGLFYRLSAFVLAITFTHAFLIERTLYNNHYYLIVLLAWLGNVLPLHRGWSLDSLRNPKRYSPWLPRWMLWLIRFQIGVVYFFGGIAKLDADWLRGQPMGMWLAAKSNLPEIGPLLANGSLVPLFSIGGLLIDLLAVPLLLWRRTRLAMFAVLVIFHLLNSLLFTIGLFPWLMIVATLIFFEPDWPRRLFGIPNSCGNPDLQPRFDWTLRRTLVASFLGVYVAIQLLVPLRLHLDRGNPSWTEYGQLFAWRMMLRQKLTGIRFYGTNPANGQHGVIDITQFLNQRQAAQMSRDPDLIVQFSRQLADYYRRQGVPGMEIRAKVLASLNGRKPQLLIDPTVDLAREQRRLTCQTWVQPLTEPFRADRWNVPVDQWERFVDETKSPGPAVTNSSTAGSKADSL